MVTTSTDSRHSFAVRGGCFGFEIRSPLEFEYLRTDGATPLYIEERATEGHEPSDGLIYEWSERPAERLRTALYAANGTHGLWVDTAGWFQIDRRIPEIDMPPLARNARPTWRETIIWGTPIALCFMGPGRLSIHAASVDVGGQGLLLAAPGTFGKTTLAGGFLKMGHRVLSDDVACCALGDQAEVLPGPAVLRLRRDVYEAVEFPGTIVADRTATKVCLSLQGAQRGAGAPVPLRGIALLHKGEGKPTLARVAPHEAVRDLLMLTSNLLLDRASAFEDVTALVNTVPVWRLDRRLDYQELPRVVDLLATACLRGD
jgi:hypothetical protein